jgi:hypothetical protein
MPDQSRRHRSPPPSSSGVITLGQIKGRLDALAIVCDRCGRQGRLALGRLIAQHETDMPVPDLLRLLSADCPRRQAGKLHDPCGVCAPGLVGLGL